MVLQGRVISKHLIRNIFSYLHINTGSVGFFFAHSVSIPLLLLLLFLQLLYSLSCFLTDYRFRFRIFRYSTQDVVLFLLFNIIIFGPLLDFSVPLYLFLSPIFILSHTRFHGLDPLPKILQHLIHFVVL